MDRFWNKVNKTNTCWLWMGALNNGGYGAICIDGYWVMAHRFAWELEHREIPSNQIHHTCHNRACVNIAHLEHVTTAEHGKLSKKAQQTHCKRGHEFTHYNTQIKLNGTRSCKACQKITRTAKRLLGEDK